MFGQQGFCLSIWQRDNAQNISFETLNGAQFTLTTQLIKQKSTLF